jgi:hypothetical protein
MSVWNVTADGHVILPQYSDNTVQYNTIQFSIHISKLIPLMLLERTHTQACVCECKLVFVCQSVTFLPTYNIQWKLCSSSQSYIAQ